jgi:hypothetical protein
MSDDDQLLNYAILIVRDARAGKPTHDPAVAMQALMYLLETTGGLWKEYQALLKVELKRLPQTERPIRKRHLREAKARANAAAAAAFCDEMEAADTARPAVKVMVLEPHND